MQGSWSVTGAGKALPPAQRDTARVRLRLDDGRTLWGVDLPVVELVRTEAERSVVGYLGPDPLRSDWDADAAVQRLTAAGGRPSVAALLDQRLMAGLGNMWANEVCFLRGVWPWTPVADVDVAGLVATAARGLRASVTVPGMFQTTTGVRRRGERHFVVGRAGRPCLRCGTTVAVRAEVMNDPEQRRTWWCPHCQPEPATPVS